MNLCGFPSSLLSSSLNKYGAVLLVDDDDDDDEEEEEEEEEEASGFNLATR